jgi:hypothetical protein
MVSFELGLGLLQMSVKGITFTIIEKALLGMRFEDLKLINYVKSKYL